MEDIEVNFRNYPYIETTYLDDDNAKHIVYLKDTQDLKFYKDRFTILNTSLRED